MRTYKIELRLIAEQTNPAWPAHQIIRETKVIETPDLVAAELTFGECQRVIEKEVAA